MRYSFLAPDSIDCCTEVFGDISLVISSKEGLRSDFKPASRETTIAYRWTYKFKNVTHQFEMGCRIIADRSPGAPISFNSVSHAYLFGIPICIYLVKIFCYYNFVNIWLLWLTFMFNKMILIFVHILSLHIYFINVDIL